MELSSPMSSVSYHTALSSPRYLDDEPMAFDQLPLAQPQYRSAIPLPDVVRTHCHVLIDEGLYSNALTLLQDLFVPGAANQGFKSRPTYAPLPLHIEIASALLIHPKYTNQAISADDAILPAKSITFLRNILHILGPKNANLKEAFSFDNSSSTSRSTRRGRHRDIDEDTDSSEGDGYDHPKVLVANRGRLRRNAKDFWHMVGWAFNCSVKYPQRWKYWNVWLEYMLDVLDEDWYNREEQDQDICGVNADVGAGPVEGITYALCRESLLVQYLMEVKGRSSGLRRVVRSVFADGCIESIKEFPEVWANETKTRKPVTEETRKRDFGDYDDEEEDQTSEHFQQSTEDVDLSFEDPMLGGPDSIKLRIRVLIILSRMAAYFPKAFSSVEDVYDAIYMNMKPLPLPAFQMFLIPSNKSLPNVMYVTLTQLFFRRMLPANAPQPRDILIQDGDDQWNQAVIEHCFLPFPANTTSVVDNAKVSILVESVFRFFARQFPMHRTPSLNEAIETGVKAREKKAKGSKKKRAGGVAAEEDEEAMDFLKLSGERLRALGEWIDANSGSE